VCGNADVQVLKIAQFHWHKSIDGGDGAFFEVQHISTHELCPDCLQKLLHRRQSVRPLRITSRLLCAVSVFGMLGSAIFVVITRRSSLEQLVALIVLIASAALLAIAEIISRAANRNSVPTPLLDMACDGWICRKVQVLLPPFA
jgi:hypothetical protein